MDDKWIEVNIPFWSSEGESFTGKKLNQPGTLIEIESGEQFLIGDINDLGGECDDCMAFPNKTIIKRYKVVWEEVREGG